MLPIENSRYCVGKRLYNNRPWFCSREFTTLKGIKAKGDTMQTPRVAQAAIIMLAYVVLGCFAAGSVSQQATLVTYPAPEGAQRADDFVVKVDGTEIFVYDCEAAAFAGF